MHWGDKQSLFVHFSLFFELKSDILFICMDNMCATWSHDFKIYCDWPWSICSLHLLFVLGLEVAQAANARGPISNKEEVADSFQACSVCIMDYFHPPDVLI